MADHRPKIAVPEKNMRPASKVLNEFGKASESKIHLLLLNDQAWYNSTSTSHDPPFTFHANLLPASLRLSISPPFPSFSLNSQAALPQQ